MSFSFLPDLIFNVSKLSSLESLSRYWSFIWSLNWSNPSWCFSSKELLTFKLSSIQVTLWLKSFKSLVNKSVFRLNLSLSEEITSLNSDFFTNSSLLFVRSLLKSSIYFSNSSFMSDPSASSFSSRSITVSWMLLVFSRSFWRSSCFTLWERIVWFILKIESCWDENLSFSSDIFP